MKPSVESQPGTAGLSGGQIIGNLVVAGVMWCVHAAAVAFLIIVFIQVVPGFEQLFEEFDAALPALSVLALRISRLVVGYWYLLAILVLLVDGPLMVCLSFLPKRWRWIRTTWLVVPLVGAIALVVLVVFALLVPTQTLIRDLS